MLNIHLAGKEIPGELKKLMKERGDIDYRKTANLNIKEFTKIIIYFILLRNKMPFKKLTDINMIKDEIENTPNSIWRYSVENIGGTLRTYPSNYIKTALMRKSNASITNAGIKFKNLLYDCLSMQLENLGLDSKLNGQKKVTIYYDSRYTNIIYIKTDQGELLLAQLNIKKSLNYVYRNKSWDEVEFYLKLLKIKRPYINENINANTVQYDELVNSIIDNAKKNNNKKKSVKDININKKNDISYYNSLESLKLNLEEHTEESSNEDNYINSNDMLSSYDLLWRICSDQVNEDE